MNDDELTSLIRQHALRHRASDELRAKVQAQLRMHAPAPRLAPGAWARMGARLRNTALAGLVRLVPGAGAAQMGVAFASGVLLTLALVWAWPRLPDAGAQERAMAGDLLTLHVQSMATGALFQVASSDRHTVKPWFQGKLDYAPEVPDLQAAGFELLGGRLDTVQGQGTATLAYRLHQHMISAYVMPASLTQPAQRLTQRGFNFVHWSDGSMQIWAVTDAEAGELDRFARAWQTSMATPGAASR